MHVPIQDIVIKKENHSNRLDKEEERNLLKEGFDTLVLEGEDNPGIEWSKYGFLNGWFGWATELYFWITEPIYQSDGSLVELALFQDMDIEFTREGNHELIENAPFPLRILSLLLFYTLFFTSMAFGLYASGYMYGIIVPSSLLFLAITAPILLLRIYNSKYSNSQNRDKEIAKLIEKASENGSVLAIVGRSHKPEEYLSEGLGYKIREPKSTEKTIGSAIGYVSRFTKSYFILLSLFLVLTEVVKYLIQFV